MSDSNRLGLTFNCVDFNQMSIECTFYCDSVEGLNLWSSLTIKLISFAQRHQFLSRSPFDHLYMKKYLKVREIFGCSLGEDTCVNGSHHGFFSLF